METAAQAAIVWVGTPGIPSPFHILHCLANSMHGPEILHCSVRHMHEDLQP
jgi:hypothetical protein